MHILAGAPSARRLQAATASFALLQNKFRVRTLSRFNHIKETITVLKEQNQSPDLGRKMGAIQILQ